MPAAEEEKEEERDGQELPNLIIRISEGRNETEYPFDAERRNERSRNIRKSRREAAKHGALESQLGFKRCVFEEIQININVMMM